MTDRTAMRRTRASAPATALVCQGLLPTGPSVLDYGCGHGADCAAFGWDGYDPTHRPTRPSRRYPYVYCGYVLNTLPSPRLRARAIQAALRHLGPLGHAYVVVRRDLKTSGLTSTGTWQGRITFQPAPGIEEIPSPAPHDYAIFRLTPPVSRLRTLLLPDKEPR